MLDISTTLFSMTIVEFVMSAILVSFYFSKPDMPGLRPMLSGCLLALVAALIGSYATKIDSFLYGSLTLFLFQLCFLMANRAMRRLRGKQPRLWLELLAAGISALGLLWFVAAQNTLAYGLAVNSAIYVVLCGVTVHGLLREKRVGLRDGCRLLAVLFFLFGVFHAVNLFVRPTLHSPGSLVEQVVLLDHMGSFLAMSVAIGWSLGLLWTSYRNAELQLRAANDELEHFARAVAHDLKSPLNAVIGYLQMIELSTTGIPESRVPGYAKTAHEAANRMSIFIGDLLEEARSVQLNPEINSTDTADCVRQACDNLKLRIEGTGSAISVGTLYPVRASSVQLIRVFQNLIDNAIKYRAEDRPAVVSIHAEKIGNEVHATVQDNGIGIPGDELDAIFDYFERSSLGHAVEGHGIGLPECRRILHNLGGAK